MHRFFVPPECIAGHRATLRDAVAHQMVRVLRRRPGAQVVLLDGSGREYVTRLLSLGREAVEGEVTQVRQGCGEPRVRLTLAQGLLKGERFEWVLQKGTEVGVAAFVPLVTRRVVPRDAARLETTRYPRWRRILQEAAEQAGRARVPELLPPRSLAEALRAARGVALLPWEGERSTGLRQALAGGGEGGVALLVGPEGGFEEEEVRLAREAGARVVTLGRRTLRAETAGVVAAALVLYELGEMG